MLDRAAIYSALVDRLKDKVVVDHCSDRWVNPSELIARGKKTILLINRGEIRNENAPGVPSISTMTAVAFLYVKTSGLYEAMAELHGVFSQIEDALCLQPTEWSEGQHTTLGGKVLHAWAVDLDGIEGDLSGQAAAEVTIEMAAIVT